MDGEDSDQTAGMCRLICVFARCTGHFVGFDVLCLICESHYNTNVDQLSCTVVLHPIHQYFSHVKSMSKFRDFTRPESCETMALEIVFMICTSSTSGIISFLCHDTKICKGVVQLAFKVSQRMTKSTK